jgi:transcriptional regulator with XRE-family HTH domain
MLSVGETLKRKRLEQGIDLDTVAAQTKISAKFLEAIESDDRKSLPSSFFYRSFVEQYARFLSLNTQEIDVAVGRALSADEPLPLPGFKSVLARNVPQITSAQRFYTRRSYKSAASMVVLILVACSGIYVWWHDARLSVRLQGMIDHVRGFASARPVIAKRDKPVPPSKSAPVPKPAQPAETPDVAAATSAYKVMLELMAHEATWLSISSDGKPVFSGILEVNQSKTVGGRESARLRVGNAAGIEVRLNGKLLGPLGARGQVLTVLFTPDNFQIFSPPKESD